MGWEQVLGWPFIGWLAKCVLTMLGIIDEPNVRLGSDFEPANPADPRPGYQGWRHIKVENQQRTGRSARLTTKDALATVVRLQFISGSNASISRDGVFLVGATEPPKQTFDLIVDRPTLIPVFILTRHAIKIPKIGIELEPGAYVTGGAFFHQDLVEAQELRAGNYEISLSIRWKGGMTSEKYAFTIPDLQSTPGTASPQPPQAL